MKKSVKLFYFAIFISITFSIIFSVSAAVNKNGAWESESKISGIFNNEQGTLQQAVDQSLLINDKNSPKTLTNPTIKLDPGHKISEIWISIKEGGVRKEMTLKDAFSSARNLCGDADFTGYSGSIVNPGHLATEVEVTTSTGTKSLQDAINAKEVLYTQNYNSICSNNNAYYADSCGRLGSLKANCGNVYEPWSDWTCIDGNTRQKSRIVHKIGCSNGVCTTQQVGDTTETVTRDCTGTYNICSGGDCATDWYPELTAWTWGDDDSFYGCEKFLSFSGNLYYPDVNLRYTADYYGPSLCPSDYSGTGTDFDETFCEHHNNPNSGLKCKAGGKTFSRAPCTLIKAQYRYFSCRNSTDN
ncbi:MAG: hypothetical protein AABX93_03885 [Nanoarchaeota archaeon]